MRRTHARQNAAAAADVNKRGCSKRICQHSTPRKLISWQGTMVLVTAVQVLVATYLSTFIQVRQVEVDDVVANDDIWVCV